jgi:membrane protease subunit HflC
MKRNLITIIIGVVLVVIFLLLLFVFQVRQSEVAVVTTFGKPTAAPITEPGAYFKWPWPVQKIYKFDKRVQNFEDKFSENLTADNNPLLTSVYVGWRISDGGTFLRVFRDGSVSAAQQRLEGMLRSTKNAVVGRHPLADFVNANPQGLKFDAIEREIQDAVQSELSTNDYGIRLEFLGFKRIGLPPSVSDAVFERMKSERQLQISTTENTGKRDAQIIESTADRQAAETLANANATAIRIRALGEAEAGSSLHEFEQNPDLAIFLWRIDALKQSLNQKSTLIFDERTPPFDLFRNLPTNSVSP